ISTWEKGLVHLNPQDHTYFQYTKEDGLPSNDGVDIARGDDGVFWINTRIGPAKFDSKTSRISSLSLPKIRYNSGIFRASNNKIYLGSGNGLSSFSPEQLHGNPFPPQIDISALTISGEDYLSKKTNTPGLTLSHEQNDVTFKYIGLHFSNSKQNRYQYRLRPLDDAWINAGVERTVRYANLPPDSYTFQVKAASSDGIWSSENGSVQFTILPAWWSTWWAYAIYSGILALLVSMMYRFQLARKMAISERKRLKEINQLRNTLFTNITHEFRTPLTVIKGMADSIKSDIENRQLDDMEKSLEMIDRNSDGLLNLVNEMLDLAKIESGNMELELGQSDVVPFLKYVSESFNSLAEENQISLTIYSEIDSLMMDFDPNKLTSIVSNLLSNAIKFTPAEGKIIVHINEISDKDGEYLSVKIKDNGVGISQEELPHIFNRYFQADDSTIRKRGGTGIGLALTKELVGLMKGNISVKSTIDIGSEFIVKIPVTRNAPQSENEATGSVIRGLTVKGSIASEHSSQVASELPLLLIIEDNRDVAHYLETCLANKYETIHAANGITGIEMALEKIPDVVICDVMMPGKNGFEVCEILKTDERTDHIPIIILTAKVTLEDRLTGLSHGADAYLTKPFHKKELFIRLDQLVALRQKLISKIEREGFTTLLRKRTHDPKLLFLQKIEKLIHEDMDNAGFGSEDLAKKLLISESQLYRKIKAITGKSTAIFIRSIRLKFARNLLLTTNKTVSEVAYETGFNDPSWFSRAFKNEFGFSPSETIK
ncbi:MAG: response regulator, partial [Saprospiraceae bacterium]|nr:response regulator [Saprospiraceae bacterium]